MKQIQLVSSATSNLNETDGGRNHALESAKSMGSTNLSYLGDAGKSYTTYLVDHKPHLTKPVLPKNSHSLDHLSASSSDLTTYL